jgi:hypothetical protein
MKQVKMITPSGRVLITNQSDEFPEDTMEITEVQFDLALKGSREGPFSIGCKSSEIQEESICTHDLQD